MESRKPEQFRGAFVDLLDQLKAAFSGHVDHRMTFSTDTEDFNFCCVFCHTCDIEVVMGSRELVEMIWLDAVASPLRPY